MPLSRLDPKSLAGRLRARAMSFPEATEDFPWGERAIKVRGKAFLFMRVEGNALSSARHVRALARRELRRGRTEEAGCATTR